MALINIDDRDPWLLEYESCEKLQQDIMVQLSIRSKEKRTSDIYARLSANIRLRLKQFNNEVKELKQKNDYSYEMRHITSDEYERRSRQVERLQSKYIQMNDMFNTYKNVNDNRKNLLQENKFFVEDNHADEPEPGTSYNIQDFRRDRQQMLADQDKSLDSLSKIISRQKNIASAIGTEVDTQNEIIDDIATDMERTDLRVQNETQDIKIFSRRDSTCGYWTTIIVLFFCILILIAL